MLEKIDVKKGKAKLESNVVDTLPYHDLIRIL